MRAATQVTAIVPTTSSTNEVATSIHVRFPAAQRAGVAMGAVKGTSERVTERRDSGFASVANELKNAIMINTVTGAWLCRASCSVDDMAATAANIAEYRKNPPRKNATKTHAVATDRCGTWNTCPMSCPPPGARLNNAARRPSRKRPATPQIRNWSSDTAPTPSTLPNSSWNGRTELTSTSTIREVFSSITEPITCTPYSSRATYSVTIMT